MIAPINPMKPSVPKIDTIIPKINARTMVTIMIAKILTKPTLLMSLTASGMFKAVPKLSVSANLQTPIKNANANAMNMINEMIAPIAPIFASNAYKMIGMIK